MQAVTTIGLDIAKSVFQVHGVDAHGKVVVRRQLKRRYVLSFFRKLSPCLVGIESGATASRSCSMLWPILTMIACRKSHATALSLSVRSCGC